MQATINEAGWARRSRFTGALRYHAMWLGKTILFVLGLLLLGQALSIAMALAGVGEYRMSGINADPGTALLLSLVCGCLAAGRRTRFLLRFGTPRLSVWLSEVLALVVGMALYLVGTLAVSGLSGLLTMAVSKVSPEQVSLLSYSLPERGWALLGRTFEKALSNLPRQLLYVAEWSCLFYLLGCCLRRNKGLTLAVVIGVPLALTILLLVPAVNDAIAVLDSGDTGEATLAALQFANWLRQTVQFIDREWPAIQFALALLSLPLSYLCMRGTAQP